MLCPKKAKIRLESSTWWFKDCNLVFAKISEHFCTIHCWQTGWGSLAEDKVPNICSSNIDLFYFFTCFLLIFWFIFIVDTRGQGWHRAKCKMFAHQIFIKSHIAMLPCCQCGSINSKLVIFEYPHLKETYDLLKCLLVKYLSVAILPCCHVVRVVQSIQTVSNLTIYIWKGKMCATFSSWLSLHWRHGRKEKHLWKIERGGEGNCLDATLLSEGISMTKGKISISETKCFSIQMWFW